MDVVISSEARDLPDNNGKFFKSTVIPIPAPGGTKGSLWSAQSAIKVILCAVQYILKGFSDPPEHHHTKS